MYRHPSAPAAFGALLGALLLSACDADSPAGPGTDRPPPVASIRVTPAALTLIQGERQQLAAMPLGAAGQELPDSAVTWHSEAEAVATVSPAGAVTGQAVGAAWLVAASGAATRRVQVTVSEIPAALLTIGVAALDLDEGQVATLTATVLDAQGRPLPGRLVTWSSDDPNVVAVSATGGVTALREGATRIVARHGALQAAADLRVAPVFGGELLFSVLDPASGGLAIHRMDPRLAGSHGQPLFGSAGNWRPSVSPDGARIAFACTASGPAICVAGIDGTGIDILTDGDLFNEDEPAWSPDGQRIAFRRWAHGATPGPWNPTDIWSMDVTGGSQVNLTADGASEHRPAWSPVPVDGAYRIAFTQDSIDAGALSSRIASMRADGTDRRYETAFGPQEDLTPAWAPTGRAIVFTRAGGTVHHDLWVVDVETRDEKPLLRYTLAGAQRQPAWSPDGRTLAFTSDHEEGPNHDFRPQLYTVRPDGSQLTRRSTTPVDKADPAWVRVP